MFSMVDVLKKSLRRDRSWARQSLRRMLDPQMIDGDASMYSPRVTDGWRNTAILAVPPKPSTIEVQAAAETSG